MTVNYEHWVNRVSGVGRWMLRRLGFDQCTSCNIWTNDTVLCKGSPGFESKYPDTFCVRCHPWGICK